MAIMNVSEIKAERVKLDLLGWSPFVNRLAEQTKSGQIWGKFLELNGFKILIMAKNMYEIHEE